MGIAEEHAVSMAGGLAKQGMVPVVALYSTFLQRSYDMLMQDIGLLGLHAVFAVDRAGLVGEDGETHHGVFDVGFLRQVPGMRILCPGTTLELQQMLRWAVKDCRGPVAVRYPRGGDRFSWEKNWDAQESVCCHRQGTDVSFVTYGVITQQVLQAAALLEEKGIHAAIYRMYSVAPLPVEELLAKLPESAPVMVVEETCTGSGIREALAWELSKTHKVFGKDLGGSFVTHGNLESLYKHCGLDGASIAKYVLEVVCGEN